MVWIISKRNLICLFGITYFLVEFGNGKSTEQDDGVSSSSISDCFDPCSSSPCINGGKCIKLNVTDEFSDRYRCDCTNSYRGNNCQYVPGQLLGYCNESDSVSCSGQNVRCKQNVCQCVQGYYVKKGTCNSVSALKVSGINVSIVTGEMHAYVSWHPPADVESVHTYQVRWSYSGGPEMKTNSCEPLTKITGLLAGTTYSVYVLTIEYNGLESQMVVSGPAFVTTKTVCSSREVRKDIHAFQRLINCTVIEGNLKILLIDHASSEEFAQLHFPDLVEITEYLLLYRVYYLKTLRSLFPNLAVIRGQDLFFNFALVAFEMVDLEELGLVGLTVIERGAVRLEKNPNLCYVTTIDWSLIAVAVKEEDHFIKENKNPIECVNICPNTCPSREAYVKGRCWTAEDCQKRFFSCLCGGRPGRYCYHYGGRDHCCHDSCIGGCYGGGSGDCIACKNITVTSISTDKQMCRPSCDPGTLMYLNRRCLSQEECIKMRMMIVGAAQRSSAGRCVKDCPPGYTKDVAYPNKCILCVNECPKECSGAKIDSINAAQKLKGCTTIDGELEIRIMKGSNIGQELEENLGQIKEIKGYVWIHSSHALLSLHFFKSLEKIHGQSLYSNRFALLVNDNLNLQKLFSDEVENRLQIVKGNMFFHFNRKLCPNKIEEFEKRITMTSPKSLNDISNTTNGDQMPCFVTQLNFSNISVTSSVAIIQWEHFLIPDARNLLSYVVYYKEAPHQNVSIYEGRDACSNDIWETRDVLNKVDNVSTVGTFLVNLKAWTQYAVYVQTYTTASAKHRAMSRLVYFRTHPAMPTSPANLVVTSVRPYELLVTWDPPRFPQGNVTHYEVYWRKRDISSVQYSKRNYCIDPLKRIDLDVKKTKETEKEQVKKNETIDGHTCCACPRSEEEKASEQLERQIQIQFENYLHNKVFTKRQKTRNEEKCSTEPTFNFQKSKSAKKTRKRREVKEDSFIETLEKVKYTHSNANDSENEIPTDKINNDTKPAERPFFKAVSMTTELVLCNLGHYEDYSIEVIACHERDPHDLNKPKLCSNRAITIGRTLPNKESDSLDPSTIRTFQNTSRPGDVLITWEEPANPNGLIITYHIEYSNVNIPPDHEKPKLCISQRDYTKVKGRLLSNLSPANYSFRIQATSLAGKGEWTPYRFFLIPTKQESEPIRKEIVIAIAVSAVVIMIPVAIILWFVVKKWFGKPDIPDYILNMSANPDYASSYDLYIPDEWEVDRDKVKLLKELGHGSFGMVYKGILYEDNKKMGVPVAVKTVNVTATLKERTSFLKEASIMKGFKCHHVVRLLGVVSKGQPALVIMELMSNGDLKNFLRLHRPDEEDNDGRLPPTLKRIIQMSGEIADGMAYLADKKFVHRDLAARNCMVAEDLTVKIGDFGMTRDIYETDYYRKGDKGLLPVRWMGPESLKDGLFTSMSDVWSFGVVLWEMATLAEQPYQGLSNDEVLKYVVGGKIMERPDGCPQRLYELMVMCWQYRPKNRPTFKEIIEKLVPELDPEYVNKSYFFSEESRLYEEHKHEKHEYEIDEDDVGMGFDDTNQDDLRRPFIDNTWTENSLNSRESSYVSDQSSYVNEPDFRMDNFTDLKLGTEPCDCVMLQETGLNLSDNDDPRHCSDDDPRHRSIPDIDGEISSVRSSHSENDTLIIDDGFIDHSNRKNEQPLPNGHIPPNLRTTTC